MDEFRQPHPANSVVYAEMPNGASESWKRNAQPGTIIELRGERMCVFEAGRSWLVVRTDAGRFIRVRRFAPYKVINFGELDMPRPPVGKLVQLFNGEVVLVVEVDQANVTAVRSDGRVIRFKAYVRWNLSDREPTDAQKQAGYAAEFLRPGDKVRHNDEEHVVERITRKKVHIRDRQGRVWITSRWSSLEDIEPET